MSHSSGSPRDTRRPSRQETSPEGGPPRISFPSESGAGASSPQFPRGGESYNSRDSHHHPDPQVAQDIDAARQMSRARATSIDHRETNSPTSPRVIPTMGRRPSMQQNDDPTIPPTFSATSPSHARQVSGSYMGRSPMAARSQAARFYRQPRRQGSNTSLDSASHYIDHRHHHSMSASQGNQATLSASTRQTSRLGQQNSFRDNNVNESAVDDEPMAADVDDIPRRSRDDLRDDQDEQTQHTMSRRPSALEDDVCFPMPGQGSPPQEHREYHHEDYPDDHRDYEEMQEDEHHHHMHDGPRNAAGRLPPGYPFAFDLQALEEYAVEERTKLAATNAAGVDFSNGGLRNRIRGGRAGRADDGDGTYGGTAYGISPESDDATFYSRRPRKPQADNAQGKYQRKLALFESGGTAPPPQNIFGGRDGADVNTPLLGADGKSASPSDLPSYQPAKSDGGRADRDEAQEGPGNLGRSYSQPAGPGFPGRKNRKAGVGGASAFSLGAGGLGAPTPADKPYRFTFYSNALPSTIHARHIGELPAKGQTFEELFSGLDAGTLGGAAEESSAEPSAGSDEANAAGGSKINASGSQPSALTAQLAARGALTSVTGNGASGSSSTSGRREGTTAPPTRSGTPVPQVTGAPARNSLNAVRQNSQRVAPPPPAGNTAGVRTMPGGGIRMDQDPEANTWWLDVLSPTDTEMKLLSRVFGIHPLTTEDILMEETREKIELFRNYYLVCFRSFDQDPYSPTYLEPLNMYIIVFREGTLSFHFRATPHPQNVRRRIKQLKDYINVTSDWISYALIDDITDAFGPLIQSIEYEVDSIDELVLILKDVEQSDMLRRIGACRKKVMGLLRLMGNKADVVKGLAKRCNENWSVAPKSDIGLYLSDIQDHLITMTQNLSHFEKILSRSHSNYLAQISIEMTEANNRANDVLSKLTALGTVIVPLNVITGIFGMNVQVPGQYTESLTWFWSLCSGMILIAVLGYWLAIRYLQR
ncbi:cora-domain-containing protein [Microstroma glucosiphilum]|uniref:Cora-domain-containing protein n=1 Tax=Pseudomicrostroma glucosiphilum TaxID=1684307 RepID=A0A316U1T7_9BASI|nr:cora-domain-containing protein [Pseudomicrostroma glucosiphilum]PWN18451.1 cora-domain-containing protein [Pseudomicrostroma glucosiphilum]